VQHRWSKQLLVLKRVAYSKRASDAEVRLLPRLEHMNIISYKNSFVLAETQELCILMEYCEGGDLAELIRAQSQSLDEQRVLDCLA